MNDHDYDREGKTAFDYESECADQNPQGRAFTVDEMFPFPTLHEEYRDETLPDHLLVERVERISPNGKPPLIRLRTGQRVTEEQFFEMRDLWLEGGVQASITVFGSPEASMPPAEQKALEQALADHAVKHGQRNVYRRAVAYRLAQGLTASDANYKAGQDFGWNEVGVVDHYRGTTQAKSRRAGQIFKTAQALIAERATKPGYSPMPDAAPKNTTTRPRG